MTATKPPITSLEESSSNSCTELMRVGMNDDSILTAARRSFYEVLSPHLLPAIAKTVIVCVGAVHCRVHMEVVLEDINVDQLGALDVGPTPLNVSPSPYKSPSTTQASPALVTPHPEGSQETADRETQQQTLPSTKTIFLCYVMMCIFDASIHHLMSILFIHYSSSSKFLRSRSRPFSLRDRVNFLHA